MIENNEELLPTGVTVDEPVNDKKKKVKQPKKVKQIKIVVPSVVDLPPDPNYDVSKRPANVLDIIKKWDELFDIYSFNNKEYSRICLHLLIGQAIRNCRTYRAGISTDPRISVLYLKPTFTGGSAGYDIVARFAKKLGLRIETIADTSDAALIGSYDKEEGEIKGILDKSVSDIVYWGEPSAIFKDPLPAHQQKLKNYIQMGLNPIDSEESKLNKPLKYGNSHCECECSMMLVTFNPIELKDNALKTGFLLRFFFMSKYVTVRERANNAAMDYARYNVNVYTDIDSRIEEIANMLKHVIEFGKTNKTFYTPFEAIQKASILSGYEFSIIDKANTTERIKELQGAIQSSNVRKSIQIAMHHAALRFSKHIEIEDIKYAFEEVLNPEMETVKHYLEESAEHSGAVRKEEWEEDSMMSKVAAYLMINNISTPEIPKKAILSIIKDTFKVTSSRSIYDKYKLLIKTGEIKESVDGNSVILLKYKSNP